MSNAVKKDKSAYYEVFEYMNRKVADEMKVFRSASGKSIEKPSADRRAPSLRQSATKR